MIKKRQIEISKKRLKYLYITKNLSAKTIANLYNCYYTTIYNKLKKFNIKPNKKISKNFYCIDCGKEISYGHKRCINCIKKYQHGKNHPNWKGGKIKTNCTTCKKILYRTLYQIKTHNNHFCNRKCQSIWRIGKFQKTDNACWKGGWKNNLGNCVDCGKKLRYYHSTRCIKCRGIFYSGENSSAYIHGHGNFPYNLNFSHKLKRMIRQRDNFTCQCCGLKEDNHFLKNKRVALTVHHIDYNKQNCSKNNLITLCNKCNIKANGNKEIDRDYWYAYYRYIMENYK